jgi:hypothetical protein
VSAVWVCAFRLLSGFKFGLLYAVARDLPPCRSPPPLPPTSLSPVPLFHKHVFLSISFHSSRRGYVKWISIFGVYITILLYIYVHTRDWLNSA